MYIMLLCSVTNTCGVDLEDCIPTFGYKHLLNLTADGTAFEVINKCFVSNRT